MHKEQPGWKSLMLCFLRTYMVAGAFNTRGMQNVGLVYVMEPGLRALYPNEEKRREARKRYLRHYNTHLFWTPLLAGLFLSLEDKIARGLFSTTVLENMKNTTTYTLSAIGDSVFGGSLLVFWSLSTACLAVSGHTTLAIIWAALWFLALQVFKLATFIVGFREGLKFLLRLKKWDLINWGRRLKLVNAAVMVLLFGLIHPPEFPAWLWLGVMAVLGLAAWAVSRTHASREIVAISALTVYLAWPLINDIWEKVF